MNIYEKLFSVSGKTALVTGGAKGVGALIAETLVSAGCHVFITGRSRSAGQETTQRLQEFGQCTFFEHDLSSSEGIRSLVKELTTKTDSLNILVNNAGTFSAGDISTATPEKWDALMALNLRTPFFLAQELLPLLTAAATNDDPARIINIGSIGGLMAQSNSAYAYGCSKAAIHQLTRMLASDLRQKNITVNAIAPGFFPSEMTKGFFDAVPNLEQSIVEKIPAHRLGTLEDIGGTTLFLSSRAGAYLTGTISTLDGGFLCAS